MFSKKATKFDKIFAVDLTCTTYCQIDGEDFINFCGLLRKHELYLYANCTLTSILFDVKRAMLEKFQSKGKLKYLFELQIMCI